VWSNDPESYAGGSVATGRVSLAGQVRGDDPDYKGYPGPPGWELGVTLTTSHRKNYCYETEKGGQDSYRAVEPMMMMMITVIVLGDTATRELCESVTLKLGGEIGGPRATSGPRSLVTNPAKFLLYLLVAEIPGVARDSR
jgi:hypothetical protein